MTPQLKIPAIPTLYKGRQYRSRLEARWAAFFDLLEWRHEYEPFDLDGWIPDFLIHGKYDPVLVEVKPFTSLEQFDIDKTTNALRNTHYWGTEVLLLGIAPTLGSESWKSWENYQTVSLGWLGEFSSTEYCADTYCFNLAPLTNSPGFFHEYQSYTDRMSGRRHKEYSLMKKDDSDPLWAQAANAVMWKPPGGRQ